MRPTNLPKPFNGVAHRSFHWEAGDHAALLLHGFPGTPAEMHPLASVLWDAGWTVHGPMLPGLGADIANLENRTLADWTKAAIESLERLSHRYRTILLVGYSMGGALALHAAYERPPAGLVLLAPFSDFAQAWLRMLWPVVQRVVPRVKPLKYADFSLEEVRQPLLRMFGNIDLDSLEIQRSLREIIWSSNSLAQVHSLGRSAFKRAAGLELPTLIIQGDKDNVAHPECTARLVSRFPNQVIYQSVDAAHNLIDPQNAAWKTIKDSLLNFAVSIAETSRSIKPHF
jgi:carboxylesterase